MKHDINIMILSEIYLDILLKDNLAKFTYSEQIRNM